MAINICLGVPGALLKARHRFRASFFDTCMMCTSPRNRRRPCIISMPAMAAVAAGDDDSGSGNVPSVKTRVQLRAPLMNRAQLERYVRTDRNIRTLRADLPRLLERSMTADVFANNITMDDDLRRPVRLSV